MEPRPPAAARVEQKTYGNDGFSLSDLSFPMGQGYHCSKRASKQISSCFCQGFSFNPPPYFKPFGCIHRFRLDFNQIPFFPTGQKGLEINMKIDDHIDR
jgi:hypothetical protein